MRYEEECGKEHRSTYSQSGQLYAPDPLAGRICHKFTIDRRQVDSKNGLEALEKISNFAKIGNRKSNTISSRRRPTHRTDWAVPVSN